MFYVYVRVQGELTIGDKLSDRQYAKKVKAATCEKIDSCISEAINDEEATQNYLSKLYSFQEDQDCK